MSGSSDSGQFSVPPDSPGGAEDSPSDSDIFLPKAIRARDARAPAATEIPLAKQPEVHPPSFLPPSAGGVADDVVPPGEGRKSVERDNFLVSEDCGRPGKATKSAASERTIVFPEDTRKLKVAKALVQCNDPELDLSGEIGAIGRLRCNGQQDITLDLKGKIYTARILPSASFAVVSVGDKEARVESIMNDFLELKEQGTLFNTESIVEGDAIEEAQVENQAAGINISASQGIANIDESDEEALAKAGRVTGSRKGVKSQKIMKSGKGRRKTKRKA